MIGFPGLSKDIVSNSDLVWVVLAGDKHVRLLSVDWLSGVSLNPACVPVDSLSVKVNTHE